VKEFYVYILTNQSRTLYVGMTNDLERRVQEHREGKVSGFTRRYGLKRLAYYERFPTALSAIEREKQLKGWLRARKIALIEGLNPEWKDLIEGPTEEMEAAGW
jgi:putative endonuclease